MIKKLKSKLRKKFELYKVFTENQNLILNFSFENFMKFNENKFSIKVNGSESNFEITKNPNNCIEIKINFKNLPTKDFVLTFYHKNKKLWVVPKHNLNNIIELNNSISIIKTDKNITFNKYKTDFNFMNETKQVEIQEFDNNYMKLKTQKNIKTLILVNQLQQIEISIYDNKMNLESIKETINNRSYKVYLVSNQTIYPVQFTSSKHINYLIMNYKWTDNYLYVSFNKMLMEEVNITSMINEHFLRISAVFPNNKLNTNYDFISLGVIDVDLNDLKYLNTKCNGSKIRSKLILNETYTNKNKKLIAILQEKDTNNKRFFCLDSKNKVTFTKPYYFGNQILKFDIKKNNGLNIINSKPKIKKEVNFISEHILSIHFLPDQIYAAFQYYLTFEERVSQKRWEIEISTGEQNIKIPYDKLELLKTASKNIIDIFITIYDGSNIVRKEKIKFNQGTYKKDNYITLKEKSFNNKKVYYMLTLTPFKNVKIESFELTLDNYKILENGKKDNNVWLIGERTDTAQDNGIEFFKWLQNNTNIKSYYVIDETSGDYNKIKNLNNIVTFGSQQHFKIASQANVLISTHDLENILPYKTGKHFWGYENSIRIFLQHGVLGRKKVEYDKKYYDLPFHLFNVSSTDEKYNVVVDQLGYEEKDVAITGLPRFDNLPLKSSNNIKKILIMPTWRDWLNNDYTFDNSEYMKRYLNLINHPKFEELIRNYDLEVNFYPHYRSQAFFKHHLDQTGKLINYVHLGEQTVQELLIKHDVLITDYSSVSFDFSYMQKPVIFFHFDVERFFRKGILRPIDETFIGNIVYNEEEVLNKIENIIKYKNNNLLPDLTHVFDFIDHKNNQRVYYEILKKINEKSD